jgi:hypothetical protein
MGGDWTAEEEVAALVSSREVLRSSLWRHRALLDAASNPRRMDVNKLIAFADFITDTLHAPEGWKEGFPLVGSHPPVPQPDQMRRGKLAEMAMPAGDMSVSSPVAGGINVEVEMEVEVKMDTTDIAGASTGVKRPLDDATSEVKQPAVVVGQGQGQDQVSTESKPSETPAPASVPAPSPAAKRVAIDFGMDSDSD